MTDSERAALAAGVKNMMDARDLTTRSELAAMRATVEAMDAELRELRAQVKVMPAEMHSSTMRMIGTLGTKLSAELPAAIGEAAERHLARAMVSAALPADGVPS